MTLLSLLLIFLPLDLPLPCLPPGFEQVCITLEIFSPGELKLRYLSPREAVAYARQMRRELRDAPTIQAAEMLPTHIECRRMECFFDDAICQTERQRDLFGASRWEEFEGRLRELRRRKYYWEQCSNATNGGLWMADRRRALMWLRDHSG